VQSVQNVRIGEVVNVIAPDGRRLEAEVLEIDGGTTLVEVYGPTQGLDVDRTSVVFTDAIKRVPLSPEIIGRSTTAPLNPRTACPSHIPELWKPITGCP
jgi:vacuolar-type H+-ATPase subunit B/Vma2